jgi:mannose-6-phosphate isomerase-like protein (cupin superfamily)
VRVQKIRVDEKLALFEDRWSPKTITAVNDCAVRLVKLSGPFVWYRHEAEDELFWVLRGRRGAHGRGAVALGTWVG